MPTTPGDSIEGFELPAEGLRRAFASVVAVRPDGRVLLVREAKARTRGLWNLPGGRLGRDEPPAIGAQRELLEETGLDSVPDALVAVHDDPGRLRFVLRASLPSDAAAAPGDEILEVAWRSSEEIAAIPDAALEWPASLRAAVAAVAEGRVHALGALVTIRSSTR